MRIWSLHPRHLDRQGLLAAWREALLAQAVLAGRTKGYRHHPQLVRFAALTDPSAAIGCYLSQVASEAELRGYRFDRARIGCVDDGVKLVVTEGQLKFEWAHLLAKLHQRDPQWWSQQLDSAPEPHPMFDVRPGPVEPWERP